MNPLNVEDIKKHSNTPKEPQWNHFSEALASYHAFLKKNPDLRYGHTTAKWHSFNQHFGGAREELVVITADTGQGKSTFARAWLREMVYQGIPSALISLEDPMSRAVKHFAAMETGMEIVELGSDEAKHIGAVLSAYPMFYLNHHGMIQDDLILKAIRYASQEKGVKFFVVDHLDYIRKNHAWSKNESYVIGDFLRELSTVAQEEMVTIVLIVHPSKLAHKGEGSRPVGLDELKGSSSIKQEAASVLSVYRPNPGTTQTDVRFLKIREAAFGKNVGGKISFYLHPKKFTYEEMQGGLSYE